MFQDKFALISQISFKFCFHYFEDECNTPLGMEDKTISDSDLTASSEYPGLDHGPRLARLNLVRSDYYQYVGAWSPHYKIVGEWIQVSVLLEK